MKTSHDTIYIGIKQRTTLGFTDILYLPRELIYSVGNAAYIIIVYGLQIFFFFYFFHNLYAKKCAAC